MIENVRRIAPTNVRANGESGLVEFSLPLFGAPDSFGTAWAPGVFDKHLSDHKPKIVGWDHFSGARFGVVSDWHRTKEGYDIKAQFNMQTREAADAFSMLKFDLDNGSPDEWSFRFEPVETEVNDEIPTFTEARVYEFSPVLVGAVADTTTVAARSAPMTDHADVRDNEAHEIALDLVIPDDAVEHVGELIRLMEALAAALPETVADLVLVRQLEAKGMELLPGKRLSVRALSKLREAAEIINGLVEWASESEDEDDVDHGDDDNEQTGRTALAMLGTSALAIGDRTEEKE